MELYKANLDGIITRDDPDVKSGQKVSSIIRKGELILVKKVDDLIEEKWGFPYKKYTLWNGSFAVQVPSPDGEIAYKKASFADVPEYLLIQIKKPKVYITIGLVLTGLAVWSIVQERKNN
jgi:hypothetical protein